MDANTRMSMLQAKDAGAPPSEPPMAPPMMEGEGELPPPDVMIPQIAEMLMAMAGSLSPEQAEAVTNAATQLQAVFSAKPPQSEGMSPLDAEAYGEPTAGM